MRQLELPGTGGGIPEDFEVSFALEAEDLREALAKVFDLDEEGIEKSCPRCGTPALESHAPNCSYPDEYHDT